MDGKKIRYLGLPPQRPIKELPRQRPISLALIAALFFLTPTLAAAAVIEISAMLAYSTSDFADGYKSTQRRYSGSMDFKFTPVSALQFEYMDSSTSISYNTTLGQVLTTPTREAITYLDKVYSFNWVQNLVPSKWIIQPYFVIGGGRLTRRYTDELPEFGFKQVTTQNVVTGTGGLGIRLFFTRSMAIKAEAKTYVPNFQFSKWKENQMLSVGLSWMF